MANRYFIQYQRRDGSWQDVQHPAILREGEAIAVASQYRDAPLGIIRVVSNGEVVWPPPRG